MPAAPTPLKVRLGMLANCCAVFMTVMGVCPAQAVPQPGDPVRPVGPQLRGPGCHCLHSPVPSALIVP